MAQQQQQQQQQHLNYENSHPNKAAFAAVVGP